MTPWLIGGSADLTGSNNTKTNDHEILSEDTPAGNYLHYGVREHAMVKLNYEWYGSSRGVLFLTVALFSFHRLLQTVNSAFRSYETESGFCDDTRLYWAR